MKHHIYLEYSKKTNVFRRLDMIKEAGFDGIFMKIDENENHEEIVAYAKELGLVVEAMHLAVKNCNHLWIDDELGEEYTESIIQGIITASKLKIPIVVMHISSGNTPPPINEIAIKRIKEILSYSHEYQVYLALENLRRLDYLDYIFENINHPYLKFCFDSGHANAFTKNIDTFEFMKYQDKLVCIHLSDNDGSYDQHLVPSEGNINWDKLMKTLRNIDFTGPLTLEAVKKDNDFDEKQYLQFSKHVLVNLQNLYQEGSKDE